MDNKCNSKNLLFRISAENAIGTSEPSPCSDLVTVTSDLESTEPHFLRELRDVTARENQKVNDLIFYTNRAVRIYCDSHLCFTPKYAKWMQIAIQSQQLNLFEYKCQNIFSV